MGVYDFVAGILAGIVLACLNFVVQTSQKSAIRASYTGDYVQSTVRRHAVQRDFLNRVGHQVCVMKLAGYLFFGSIVRVEKKSRALIDEESWRHQPISYLIFDLQHVNGLDYSAAEAFTRLDRILARRGVQMIFSGVDKNQEVGKSLRGVGLWTDDSNVEFFETLNMGLEFCENELLASLYTHGRNREQHSPGLKGNLAGVQVGTHSLTISDIVKPEQEEETLAAPEAGPEFASPRRSYLHEAATTVLDSHSKSTAQRAWSTFKQPLPLILQTFQSLSDKNQDFWFLALPFFMRREYHANTMLYERGVSSAVQNFTMGESLTVYSRMRLKPSFCSTPEFSKPLTRFQSASIKSQLSPARPVASYHSSAILQELHLLLLKQIACVGFLMVVNGSACSESGRRERKNSLLLL